MVRLHLSARTKEDALAELLEMMKFSPEDKGTVLRALVRREAMGSTGIGTGIAVPHCRTPVAPRLQIAYGRQCEGIDFDAIDGQPVVHVFLLVAPPLEVSNEYLPALGCIAQLARDREFPARLMSVASPREFLVVLAEQED
jgi:mannitol/fructose-specific phosphotransferase system IIA component (Ntr-type)